MSRYCLWSALCALVAFVALACNNATKDVTIFQAQLSGANEVPPRGTVAGGATGFTVEGTTVRYSVEVHSISAITGAHIHSGAAGINGPIRANLFPNTTQSVTTSPTGAVDGILIEGSFTAANVTGISFDQLLSEMRTGAAYANVHTTEFPGGAIRGQIQLVK